MDAKVTPSRLMEMTAPPPSRRRRWAGLAWAAVPLALGLGATLEGWQYSRNSNHAVRRVQFEFTANGVVNEITDRLEAHVQTLWGAAGLLAANPSVTREQWRAYVDALQLTQRLPSARVVGFAKRVPKSEKEAHVRTMRAQGFANYDIWPERGREESIPITLFEPLENRNGGALGFDLATRPDRAVAMERARDSGTAALTSKVMLLGEPQMEPQPGFVLFLPIYRAGATVTTIEQRRSALIGFAYSPFRARDFILNRSVADYAKQAGAALEIYDGPGVSEPDLLYRSPDFPDMSESAPAIPYVTTVAEIVAGRTWTFRLAALPSFAPNVDQQIPMLILLSGIMISLLASAVAGALAFNRAQAVEANGRLRADMAKQEQIEDQLRRSEAKFRHLFDNLPLPTVAIDRETLRYIAVNEAAVAKYGYSHAEFARMRIMDVRPAADVPGMLRYMESVHGQESYGGEFRHQTRDGRVLEMDISAHTIDLDGRPATIVMANDITERKRAEEALFESEQRLRQSQKLEAIGQLTGGIAHDFNNILTVITGTIEILADGVAHEPKLAAITKLIDEAATRGADLTRDLLAFARRQPLQPHETDINALVIGASKLFRSTLGEHIEIESKLDMDLWPAFVDPSHLTTALLNLALNARDAMPKGGKLVLETGNVELDEAYAAVNSEARSGAYVMAAVSDNGTGIPPDVLEKVFEPFFTTKDVGKGTGLGLSMVYGFVKQSNGHIKIYSEQGYGTTIKIYLPRATARDGQLDEPATATPVGGAETILVVEDNELVRNYVTAQLSSLGYSTHVAANAAEALAMVEQGVPFDLLFTDVVMPGGMNGHALAVAVHKHRPQTRVLFTSGYTEHAAFFSGRLEPGVALLNKPYRKADLATKLRQALDAPPNAA
jgi:PAS domain S-box-containing protein